MTDYSTLSWPILRSGDDGPLVKAAQRLMVAEGAELDTDAEFGPETEKAVEQHQERHRIAVDGVIGEETWPALVPVLRLGDKSEAVLAAQELMGNDGGVTFDGVFGIKTEGAVRATQETAEGTKIDGILGHRTWSILTSMFDGG